MELRVRMCVIAHQRPDRTVSKVDSGCSRWHGRRGVHGEGLGRREGRGPTQVALYRMPADARQHSRVSVHLRPLCGRQVVHCPAASASTGNWGRQTHLSSGKSLRSSAPADGDFSHVIWRCLHRAKG